MVAVFLSSRDLHVKKGTVNQFTLSVCFGWLKGRHSYAFRSILSPSTSSAWAIWQKEHIMKKMRQKCVVENMTIKYSKVARDHRTYSIINSIAVIEGNWTHYVSMLIPRILLVSGENSFGFEKASELPTSMGVDFKRMQATIFFASYSNVVRRTITFRVIKSSGWTFSHSRGTANLVAVLTR